MQAVDRFLRQFPNGVHAKKAQELRKQIIKGALIKSIQFNLGRLGIKSGPTSLVMTPEIEAAIRRYQQQQNLPVTGEATKELDTHIKNLIARLVELNKQDNAAYQAAIRKRTRASYEDYLKQFPNGRNVADVKRRLATCRMTNQPTRRTTQQTLTAPGQAWGANRSVACAQARRNASIAVGQRCATLRGRVTGNTRWQDVPMTPGDAMTDALKGIIPVPNAQVRCQTNATTTCSVVQTQTIQREVCQ